MRDDTATPLYRGMRRVVSSLVPRPTSQLRMDYIIATLLFAYSGHVIHPQLRCGSGYETRLCQTLIRRVTVE